MAVQYDEDGNRTQGMTWKGEDGGGSNKGGPGDTGPGNTDPGVTDPIDPIDPIDPTDTGDEGGAGGTDPPPGNNTSTSQSYTHSGGYKGTGGTAPAGGEGPPIPDSGTGIEAEQTDWEVTDEQTVMGQLEKNYDRGSPFFEQAAEKAKRGHQAGGGQNSLMAEQAGINAAMDQAFKASFEDAKTFARSAEFNAAMKNQFGLAEQRFMHNATLSDQNFQHSKVLMQQQIQGQFDLMDKSYIQTLDTMWEAAEIHEGQEQRGYARTMALNGATSMSSFMSNGFGAVMDAANQPGFTPEQSAAAFKSGMNALVEQMAVMRSFWENQVRGTSSSQTQGESSYPYSDSVTENYGHYAPEASALWMKWYDQNYAHAT
jgi:hypothetical protein